MLLRPTTPGSTIVPGCDEDEEMHAALDVNIPNYASAIVTTDEIAASIVS